VGHFWKKNLQIHSTDDSKEEVHLIICKTEDISEYLDFNFKSKQLAKQ